jgi:hypothetical protein
MPIRWIRPLFPTTCRLAGASQRQEQLCKGLVLSLPEFEGIIKNALQKLP